MAWQPPSPVACPGAHHTIVVVVVCDVEVLDVDVTVPDVVVVVRVELDTVVVEQNNKERQLTYGLQEAAARNYRFRPRPGPA